MRARRSTNDLHYTHFMSLSQAPQHKSVWKLAKTHKVTSYHTHLSPWDLNTCYNVYFRMFQHERIHIFSKQTMFFGTIRWLSETAVVGWLKLLPLGWRVNTACTQNVSNKLSVHPARNGYQAIFRAEEDDPYTVDGINWLFNSHFPYGYELRANLHLYSCTAYIPQSVLW